MKKETFHDIMNNWSAEYIQNLDVPIVFVTSGLMKKQYDEEKTSAEVCKELAKNAPAFAVRGQVLGRSPLRVIFGTNDGTKIGDRVEIYRQMEDKNGNLVSKRISTAREGTMDSTMSYLYPVAGNKGSRKNGDLAVVVSDKRSTIYFDANWSPHLWGFDLTYGYEVFTSKYGIYGKIYAW